VETNHQYLYVVIVFTAEQIGMGCMGKTISLKVTGKEHQMIEQLNKQGFSNSQLLRNALHHYFSEVLNVSAQDVEENTIFHTDEQRQTELAESYRELKNEMQQLRGQLQRTQQQVERDVTALQRRLYLLSVSHPVSQQIPAPLKGDIVRDIHHQVDEFLSSQQKKQEA
jgi:hypothetical protein